MNPLVSVERNTTCEALNDSFYLASFTADRMIKDFCDRLAAAHPQVWAMFPADLGTRHDDMLRTLYGIVTRYDHPEMLDISLADLGRRFARDGMREEHYVAVGPVVVAAVAAALGSAWTAEHGQAWARAYSYVADVMCRAGTRQLTVDRFRATMAARRAAA